MEQVIERRNLHPKNTDMSGQPSHELQLDGAVYAMLNKEIAEKTRELRHVRGEDLQGLNLEELQKLEKSIETILCRVAEEKVMDLSAAGQRPFYSNQTSHQILTSGA
ncbi:hypothetical protein OIU76_025170 [Salix suchowensis]|nr:hypothetical protein OIU76_025170 [Salix suchowensis]